MFSISKTIIVYFLTVISVLISTTVFSQTLAVSGYVLNESTGTVIVNASVFESGDGIGTISNDNGYYKLHLKPGEKNFKITDSGYESFAQKFELKKDTILTVLLKPVKKTNETELKRPIEISIKKIDDKQGRQ